MPEWTELADTLAAQIADGTPLPWPADHDVPALEQPMVAALRDVERISALHRRVRAQDTLATGTQWGPLRVVCKVGEGSGGAVYLAYDPRLYRPVALKVLHPTRDSVTALAEARMLAAVKHPNVLVVHGAEVIGGRAGIWTEFVAGRTLEAELAASGPRSWREVAGIALALARAMEAVHAAGLVHRDIKLQNIMRETSGRIVLMDFGVTVAAGGSHALAGTPVYLAPELLGGGAPTVHSDVYAAGVAIFRLLSGSYPFQPGTFADLQRQHLRGPRPLARHLAPPPFADVVHTALASDPRARFRSAADLAAAVDAATRMALRSPRSRAALVPVALLSAAIASLIGPLRSGSVTGSPRPPELLIGAFRNVTDDPRVDADAGRVVLSQVLSRSAGLRLTQDSRVRETLALMQVPDGSAYDEQTFEQVAARDDSVNVVLSGDVRRSAASLVISATAKDPDDGHVLFSAERTFSNAEGLPLAAGDLAGDVRRDVDAIVPTLKNRRRQPLERVTTSSLQALRDYSKAITLGERGNWPAALNFTDSALREDPDFAMAYNWRAMALSNSNHTLSEAIEAASAAVAKAATHQRSEQLWAQATLHQLKGERLAALDSFRSLLQVQPDHYWAVRSLAYFAGPDPVGYSAAYAVRAADLRPDDLRMNLIAAGRLQVAGADDAQIERYEQHARAALASSSSFPDDDISSVLMLHVGHVWRHRDVAATERALQEALEESKTAPPAVTSRVRTNTALFYLATGRPTAARGALTGSFNYFDNELHLANIDLAEGRTSAARAHLANVRLYPSDPTRGSPQTLLAFWLYLRSGMLPEAAAIAREIRAENPSLADEYDAQVAVMTGDDEPAVRVLAPLLANMKITGGPHNRYAFVLSEAWVRRGDLNQAADVLRHIVESVSAEGPGGDWGFYRATNRLRLAALYRRLGRNREADQMRQLAAAQFAQAEPGFVDQLERTVTQDLPR